MDLCAAVVDWGDVPTWCGVAGAVAAALYARRVYRIEAARDRKTKEDERAAQASKVIAWYGSRENAASAQIVNASGLPVYDVYAEFHSPEFPEMRPEDKELGVVSPSDRPDTFLAPPARHGPWKVALRFRDAANRTWYRDMWGVLTERTPAVPDER